MSTSSPSSMPRRLDLGDVLFEVPDTADAYEARAPHVLKLFALRPHARTQVIGVREGGTRSSVALDPDAMRRLARVLAARADHLDPPTPTGG